MSEAKLMEMDEIKALANKVDGWLSDDEGALLYNLAKNCTGEGVIVEIGSWKGKSTIWLGRGSKNGNNIKIYAIDPHTGSPEQRERLGEVWTFDEFKKNIKDAKVDDVVIPIVKTSEEAAKDFTEPVELIFIDGAHEYELVKLDFELWFPKVMNGGIMVFHDTRGEKVGPDRVVVELVYKSKKFRNIKYIDSITFAEKVRQGSIKDRLYNKYALLLKNLYKFEPRIIRRLEALSNLTWKT